MLRLSHRLRHRDPGVEIIGTGQSFTGGGTGWQVNPQQADGNNVDMRAGDIVDVTASELSASVVLIEMDGAVHAAADVVSGKLVGMPSRPMYAWRSAQQQRQPRLKTEDDGNFSVDFDAFDIHQGDMVGIWYVRPDGHMVGIVRSDFHLEAELRDNDIWGMTTANSRVDLTLLSGATVKGTTRLVRPRGQLPYSLPDAAGKKWTSRPATSSTA